MSKSNNKKIFKSPKIMLEQPNSFLDFTVLKTKFFTDEGQGSIFKLRECVQSIFRIKITLEESLQKFAKNFFRRSGCKGYPL
jgi:hypothetical protein